MAAPVMTYNAKGNIVNVASLANNTSNGYPGDANTWALDFSTKWEGQTTVEYTAGGSVSATSGLKVQIFAGSGLTPDYETTVDTALPTVTFLFPTPVAGHGPYRKTFFLPTGKYVVRVTNTDVTNAIAASSLFITTATIDSIA